MDNIVLQIKTEKQKKLMFIILEILLPIIVILLLLLALIIPILLLFDVALIVLQVYIAKKINKIKHKIINLEQEKKDLELYLYENGYEEVVKNFYVSHKN